MRICLKCEEPHEEVNDRKEHEAHFTNTKANS